MKAEVTRPAFSFERNDPDGHGDDAAPPGNVRKQFKDEARSPFESGFPARALTG